MKKRVVVTLEFAPDGLTPMKSWRSQSKWWRLVVYDNDKPISARSIFAVTAKQAIDKHFSGNL